MFRFGALRLAVCAGISSAAFTNEKDTAHPTDRPTMTPYAHLSDDALRDLLRTREAQVQQLRAIYETFHYEADKCFRGMIFDYHDKALQLSQVHGRMQLGSLQISREALVRMREEQEMLSRDYRLALTASSVLTFGFWVWVRRHYVRRADLEERAELLTQHSSAARSVTGMGSYNENLFGSVKRSARNWETAWEREVRERVEEKEGKE